MSNFTKTLIVDATLQNPQPQPPFFNNIHSAANYLSGTGGTIIVEAGTYEINGDSGKETVLVPSNTTIIGRGSVVVKVTNPNVTAFQNLHSGVSPYYDSNIVLSGFKIIVACGNSVETVPYRSHVIFMQNVSDSLIEKITIEAPYNPDDPAGSNPRGVAYGHCAILFYARDFDSDRHDCQRNTIKQCFINNFGTIDPNDKNFDTKYKYGFGIYFNRHTGSAGICSDTIVKNNHVTFCLFNLTCIFAERLVIQGNIFSRAIGHLIIGYDVHKDPIYAWAGNISLGQCKDIIIRGNQINETDSKKQSESETDTGTGSHGIYPSGCERLIISGNIVCGNRKNGIKPRFAGTVSEPLPDKYYVLMGNVCYENGKNYEGNGICLQGLSQFMSLMGNSCVNNHNEGIRLQIEWETEGYPAAINNVVIGNVAILHTDDPEHPTDKPISVEDPSNTEADNLTDQLPS